MSSPSRTMRRRQLRQDARCPDCSSLVHVVSDSPRLPYVRVEHDQSCPWYRHSNAGEPFEQLRVRSS